MWTLTEAIEVAKVLENAAKQHNFTVSLGGSVLFNQHSDDDVDFVFIPRSGVPQSPYGIERLMDDLSYGIMSIKKYGIATKDRIPTDKVVVVAWLSDNRKIDFFFPTYSLESRIDAIPNIEDLDSDY